MIRLDLHENNRRSWNAATVVHNGHKLDQAVFLRGSGSTMFTEEVELLGDLSGHRWTSPAGKPKIPTMNAIVAEKS
jgi:hypothetical protein